MLPRWPLAVWALAAPHGLAAQSRPPEPSPSWLGSMYAPSQVDTALTRTLHGPGWELAYPSDAAAPDVIYEGQVGLGLGPTNRSYSLSISTYANPAATPLRQWTESFCADDVEMGCTDSTAFIVPQPYAIGSTAAQVVITSGCDETTYWFVLGHDTHIVLLAFGEHDGSALTREELRWMGLHIVQSFRWLP